MEPSRTHNEWSEWTSLGRPDAALTAHPVVHRNQDGRLELFALGAGGLVHIWQLAPNGGWSGWAELGQPKQDLGIESFAVGSNQDGRQEVFALGHDRAVWQIWQVSPNDGWSHWERLGSLPEGSGLAGRFIVGRNQDGRQELFAEGSDGNLWQAWQTAPNNGWADWKKLGRPREGLRPADRLSVGRNEDGRQELFVIGNDAALWHVWQVAPNVGWSDWQSLGTPRDPFDGSEPPKDRNLSDPLVLRNADGHLEVFAPGNGAFCNRWQEVWREGPEKVVWRRQGWNEKPRPRPDVGLVSLDGALNSGRRLEVLAIGDDGALWHAWQVDVPPFWSKWESLGQPPARIREAGRLAVGTNQDRRLEAFVLGQDGAVWHTWETRVAT